MQERLKELPKKFLEYWNKWTSKQKTIIISAVGAVVVLVAILVFILGRTKYILIDTYEDTKTASQVVQVLKDGSFTVKLGSDTKSVLVDETQYSDAIMTLATSEISSTDFSIDDLLNNSLTTTNGERLLKNYLRSESEVEQWILKNNVGLITGVEVSYMPKDTSNTILNSSKSIPISISLVTTEFFDEDSAVGIAKAVSAALGNQDTEKVIVTNQNGRVLFDGSSPETLETELDYTDKLAMQDYLEQKYIDAVTGAMTMNLFTDVNVVPHIEMNFDKVTELFTDYVPLDDEIFGVLIEEHKTNQSGQDGSGDIPGTDSNDEVDYYIDESTGMVYEKSTMDRYYQPSVHVTEKMYDSGTIVAEKCSIAVSATKVIQLTEERMQILGLLDDMTFEEYVARNSEPVALDAPEDVNKWKALVSAATGIPENNVEISTYLIYDYIEAQEIARDWSFYLQILLAVLLIAFLLFVVFRGMAPVEVTELEPELSVEQLLATTKENQSLEDVEFSEQSETRKMIEKFFDENPEAVAQLLRNWLNEEWE